MNINDLTIGEAKELASLFGNNAKCDNFKHPMIGQYCLVRTFSAGVHIGIVKEVYPALQGNDVLFESSRRLWKWEGAFTVSEVANNGIKSSSRVAEEVSGNMITGANEFIPVSAKSRKTIEACHEK